MEWIDGGPTDFLNLTFLCGRHHRLIRFSAWEVRMATDGKPEYIPPDYLDPLRRPRRNTIHNTTNQASRSSFIEQELPRGHEGGP
jgi:hypothetical protein